MRDKPDSADRSVAWPAVGVVLVTHNRPQLMRQALESILEQDYPGEIDVVVVYDRSEPELTLAQNHPRRRVRVLANDRTAGLAGGRNTGILALRTEWVALCDDDDLWLPGKLIGQLRRLAEHPESSFATTAMEVCYDGDSTVRRAGLDLITVQHLARSRMAMLHSSSFLFRRSAMIEGFGLVDETLPRSMAEDWDLLLRAARQAPIQNVDEPLVRILWGASSYFNEAWQDKNEAHAWLLAHHPEIGRDRVGYALQLGKLAFGHAVLKHRLTALRFAVRASWVNWREPRGPLALAVLVGVSGNWIQAVLNRRGHGI